MMINDQLKKLQCTELKFRYLNHATNMQQRSTSVLKWRGKTDKCIQYMKTGDDKESKEFFD